MHDASATTLYYAYCSFCNTVTDLALSVTVQVCDIIPVRSERSGEAVGPSGLTCATRLSAQFSSVAFVAGCRSITHKSHTVTRSAGESTVDSLMLKVGTHTAPRPTARPPPRVVGLCLRHLGRSQTLQRFGGATRWIWPKLGKKRRVLRSSGHVTSTAGIVAYCMLA